MQMNHDIRGGADAASAPEPRDLFRADLVLLVGQLQGPPPEDETISFTRNLDDPFGLAALLPGADMVDFFTQLAARGRLPVPVVDLTGGSSDRADFVAHFLNKSTLDDALAATHSLRQKLRPIPTTASAAQRDGLAALTLAYSRGTPIEARWAATAREFVGYPLLSGIQNSRAMLEQLAQSNLLTRRFFERLHVCEKCNSARMPVREVCIACQSPHLREENLVHHYRCAYQGPRSQFEDGQKLTCPKCDRVLRHYGVDYDAPGLVHQCEECEEIFSDPDVTFICADCGQTASGASARTIDWHHYDLTPLGERAVLEGRLPSLDLEGFISGMSAYRPSRDLAMMLDFAVRVRRRYDRQFVVVLVNFALSGMVEAIDQLRAETMVWDILRGSLRDTDFIAACEHQLILLLPETPPENASRMVERINKQLSDATALSAGIQAEILPEEKIPGLIDILRRA